MTNNEDNFEWVRRLECPASAITDSVKKLFNQGITSLLWDELAGILHPTDNVLKVRKNILVYKLKHGEKDLSFQHIENSVKLREARSQLDPQIQSLQEKCKESDFLVRQKYQQLSKIKSQRRLLKIKDDLLQLKLNEMKIQVEKCKEMCSVCRHLMPASSCQIDQNIVNEILSLVSTISTRADRKMALNRISENLSDIEISTLWNILLSKRIRDTEHLMELGTREIVKTSSKSGENMEISIAKFCGQYVATTLRTQTLCAKSYKHGKLALEYIEKINASENNISNLSEWLSLMLEVRMLETEQKCLEMEIVKLKKTLENQSQLTDDLSNLEYDLHDINTKMETCVHDIQKSLTLLKPAGTEIARTGEKLQAVLQKIVVLRGEKQDITYLNIDPSMELNVFHENVQLEALRKILLKDNVGVYRHAKFCMSEAVREIGAPSGSAYTSQFPMIRAPIYQLLNCYKILITASWLTKLENESNPEERYDFGEWISPITQDSSDDTIEILNATDLTCERIHKEIIQFNSIFDAWKYQTVQKVMALDNGLVNGATYKEWAKRYEMLLHMVRRNK